MLSVPLAPPTPMTAQSLASITGATMVIKLDAEKQRFIGWTPDAPTEGSSIKGGHGYIVNVPQTRNFVFVGSHWTNQAAAAPAISDKMTQAAWAFVVSGHLENKTTSEGYKVIVHNRRTNSMTIAEVQNNYFTAATADLSRQNVVKVGDVVAIHVISPTGNIESHTMEYKVTPQHIATAVLSVKLNSIGEPRQDMLVAELPEPL